MNNQSVYLEDTLTSGAKSDAGKHFMDHKTLGEVITELGLVGEGDKIKFISPKLRFGYFEVIKPAMELEKNDPRGEIASAEIKFIGENPGISLGDMIDEKVEIIKP